MLSWGAACLVETRAGLELAQRLQRLRVRWAFSQAQLAAALGVSRASVVRWEHGLARPAPAAWARLLAFEANGTVRAHNAEVENAAPRPAQDAVRLVPSSPVAGVPAAVNVFIGRGSELATLTALLGQTRMLTLSGVGGVGKTRLALEVARRAAGGYPDGVCVVDLGGLQEAARVAEHVANALGVQEGGGASLTDLLAAALASRRLLLVLDTCEHVLDGCAALATALVTACPDVTLLATSREHLGLAAEVVWPVSPLALPLVAGEPSDAVQLFLTRAQERLPAFALTAENSAAVAEICARLDGLPLALEMAAARVALLSPREIAGHLQDRFRLLVSPRRTAVPRQQTLRATLDWSYALLRPEAAALFRRLAVFVGGWDLAAATALAEGLVEPAMLLDLLGQLVDHSLVVAETQGEVARYRLLDTLRAYAGERLGEAGEIDAAAERHADYYLQLAEAQASLRPATAQAQAGVFQAIAREYENLRAAFGWLCERGDAGRALRLAAALAVFWRARGLWSDGREWLQRALALPGPAPARLRAEALRVLAGLAEFFGDLSAAEEYGRAAVAAAEAGEDRLLALRTLALLAEIRLYRGDRAGAEAQVKAVLPDLQELDDAAGLMTATGVVGALALLPLAPEQVQRWSEQAMRCAGRLGRHDALAIYASNIGFALVQSGAYAAARPHFETAERIALELSAPRTRFMARANLLLLDLRLGDIPGACGYAEEELRHALEVAPVYYGHLSLWLAALVSAAAGEPAWVARLFGRVDAWQTTPGATWLYWQEESTQARAAALAALGEHACAALAAEGAATPVAQLVMDVLEAMPALRLRLGESARGATRRSAVAPAISPREAEVLRLIALGQSNKEIAGALGLSLRTVERHIAGLYNRIGARGRADAIAFALRGGLHDDLAATNG